jgi:hypothetical protein
MNFKKILFPVGSIVFALFIAYFIAFKPYLRPPKDIDYFFYDVAKKFNAPDICEKIDSWAYFGPDFGNPQIFYFRSSCYRDIALLSHDTKFCEKVKPLYKLFLSGKKYSEERCIYDVSHMAPGYMPPSYDGIRKLSEILPRIGFSEERIRSYSPGSQFIGYSGEDLFYYFYSNLQRGHFQNPPGKPSLKEEFLEGVRKL